MPEITEKEKATIAYHYLSSQVMPANSIVALRELREELDKNQTNCLQHARNWKTKALVLFLLDQIFGQLTIDAMDQYQALVKEVDSI